MRAETTGITLSEFVRRVLVEKTAEVPHSAKENSGEGSSS
jgi:hypothetical protein